MGASGRQRHADGESPSCDTLEVSDVPGHQLLGSGAEGRLDDDGIVDRPTRDGMGRRVLQNAPDVLRSVREGPSTEGSVEQAPRVVWTDPLGRRQSSEHRVALQKCVEWETRNGDRGAEPLEFLVRSRVMLVPREDAGDQDTGVDRGGQADSSLAPADLLQGVADLLDRQGGPLLLTDGDE